MHFDHSLGEKVRPETGMQNIHAHLAPHSLQRCYNAAQQALSRYRKLRRPEITSFKIST